MRNHHEHPSLTPEELAEAGRVLFGDRWQSDMARELRLSDSRRIREWISGERSIPSGVRADVVKLLRLRATAAEDLAIRLENGGGS